MEEKVLWSEPSEEFITDETTCPGVGIEGKE